MSAEPKAVRGRKNRFRKVSLAKHCTRIPANRREILQKVKREFGRISLCAAGGYVSVDCDGIM